MHPTSPIQIDQLLQHAGFVRQLARELCADTAAADDVAQETWVRTLARPPRHDESPRGWLATIVRNLAANHRRAERRRAVRERGQQTPAAPLTPEAVLAAEQTRERLVRAVLALGEPYRQVLLLRFWEGLEPREIAGRLRVPGATVRTHLARGLERLRTQLDAEHGGDRSRWLAALAPWLAPRAPAVAAISLLLMKKLVVASFLVAVVALSWWSLWPAAVPLPSPVDLPTASAATGAASTAAGGDERDATRTRPVPETSPAIDVAREPRVFPATRGRVNVVGLIVDANDTPLAGVEVLLVPTLGNAGPGLAIVDDRTERHCVRSAADGGFRFAGVAEGPATLCAALGDLEARVDTIVSTAGVSQLVHLQLKPKSSHGDDVRVRVVDTTARPVAGAQVQLFAWSRLQQDHEARAASRRTPLAEATTDANGDVAWRGLGIGTGVACAHTADGRLGRASFASYGDKDPLTARIEVAAPGALRLQFTGLGNADLREATVSLHALAARHPYSNVGGRSIDLPLTGGTLLVPGLADGTYAITLSAPFAAPFGVRLPAVPMGEGPESIPNSIAMVTASVVAGRTTDATFELVPGGAIRGSVTVGGVPVRGARVRAVLAPRTSNTPAGFVMRGVHVWRLDFSGENGPDEPTGTRETHTDGAGVYELRGLPPGSWRVEVASPTLSFDRRMDVLVADAGCVELHHELQRAGVLQVAVLDATYLGLQREGEQAPVVMAIVSRDFATFAGLAPGRYVVTRFHSDSHVEPVPIGTGTVVAGRTTWIDLRAASVRCVVRGEVRSGTDPVVGVRVGTLGISRSTATAGDGSFRLDLGFRANRSWYLSVAHGGAAWSFQPPGMYPATEVNAVLQLGAHCVDLEVRNAAGRAVPCRGELYWQAAAGRPSGSLVCWPESFSYSMRFANVPTRIGPMPEGQLAGSLELDGGKTLAVRTAVPSSHPLALMIPATGTVRVRVSRTPLTFVDVRVATWLGPGAAPAADFDSADGCHVSSTMSTNEDGIAVVQAFAGEILVRMEAADLAKRVAPVRLRLEPGTETTVDLVFP